MLTDAQLQTVRRASKYGNPSPIFLPRPRRSLMGMASGDLNLDSSGNLKLNSSGQISDACGKAPCTDGGDYNINVTGSGDSPCLSTGCPCGTLPFCISSGGLGGGAYSCPFSSGGTIITWIQNIPLTSTGCPSGSVTCSVGVTLDCSTNMWVVSASYFYFHFGGINYFTFCGTASDNGLAVGSGPGSLTVSNAMTGICGASAATPCSGVNIGTSGSTFTLSF